MTMDIARLCVIALLGTLLCVLLKKNAAEQSFLLTLGVCAGVLLYILPYISEFKAALEALCGETSSQNLQIVVKALGICILAQTSAHICADYGQNALSGQIETAGKFAVLLVSLPLVRQLLCVITGLLA
ncbi:MAG: SpoIIIAC/SpoIIIAD family protein [Oscillospiraceae bacterium]|nr:SpoIIIAC/SpoIIIAD family protein [Oscillospiraceae bacterium]